MSDILKYVPEQCETDEDIITALAWGLAYRAWARSRENVPLCQKSSVSLEEPECICKHARIHLERKLKRVSTKIVTRHALYPNEYCKLLTKITKCKKRYILRREPCDKRFCSPRIVNLAKPMKRRVWETWKRFQDSLPAEIIQRLDKILNSSDELELEHARCYFKQLDRKKRLKKIDARETFKQKQILKLVDKIVQYIAAQPRVDYVDVKMLLTSNKIVQCLEARKLLHANEKYTKREFIEICNKIMRWVYHVNELVDVKLDQTDDDQESRDQATSISDITLNAEISEDLLCAVDSAMKNFTCMCAEEDEEAYCERLDEPFGEPLGEPHYIEYNDEESEMPYDEDKSSVGVGSSECICEDPNCICKITDIETIMKDEFVDCICEMANRATMKADDLETTDAATMKQEDLKEVECVCRTETTDCCCGDSVMNIGRKLSKGVGSTCCCKDPNSCQVQTELDQEDKSVDCSGGDTKDEGIECDCRDPNCNCEVQTSLEQEEKAIHCSCADLMKKDTQDASIDCQCQDPNFECICGRKMKIRKKSRKEMKDISVECSNEEEVKKKHKRREKPSHCTCKKPRVCYCGNPNCYCNCYPYYALIPDDAENKCYCQDPRCFCHCKDGAGTSGGTEKQDNRKTTKENKEDAQKLGIFCYCGNPKCKCVCYLYRPE